jgi:hypothetical protein
MSDYTKTTDFAAKDGLASGNPSKAVVGTEIDDEFNNIATHVATKYDSTDLASQAQAQALTSEAVLMTPHTVNDVLIANDGVLSQLQAVSGTLADGLFGWDSSAAADSEVILFTMGTGLEFNGTTIEVVDGLDEIVAITPTDGVIMVGNGTEWVGESGATARASLGLTIGTNVQAYGANLDDLSALGAVSAADRFMVSTGIGTWGYETASQVRTTLGIDTNDTVVFGAVTVNTAAVTENGSGHLEVDGDVLMKHNSTTYTSGEIFFSTVAPTTEGANGDIWYQYTA